MTQVRGIWCSLCRVRYAFHACKDGMPCQHEYARPVRNGILAPADLIYCFAWRYSSGFQKFEMEPIYFLMKEGKMTMEWVTNRKAPTFEASYVEEEELLDRFLAFLRKEVQLLQWSVWTEAFTRLVFGGQSATFPPRWRERQLLRVTENQASRS